MSGGHEARRCEALALEISDYLDGELSASRAAELERHLADCACCSGFAASLRRAVLACRASGGTRLPSAVRRAARQRIRELLADDRSRTAARPAGPRARSSRPGGPKRPR